MGLTPLLPTPTPALPHTSVYVRWLRKIIFSQVLYTFNPSTQEGRGRWISELEDSWDYIGPPQAPPQKKIERFSPHPLSSK